MIDALGQEIKEGWAALIDPGRGSINARKVYVIGTKGNTKVKYLSNYSWRGITTPELFNQYKSNPESFPEERIALKVCTRIIMLGEQNENP